MLACLYGPSQVDARFYGDVVGGLEEGPLQEQGEEEQHGQHVSVLQELFGGDEVDPQQSHLEGAGGDTGIDRLVTSEEGRHTATTVRLKPETLVSAGDNSIPRGFNKRRSSHSRPLTRGSTRSAFSAIT